jgi:hypothetical protein
MWVDGLFTTICLERCKLFIDKVSKLIWSHYTYLWVWLMIWLTSNLEWKSTWSCWRWEGVSRGLNNQIFWCSNPSYLQQIVFANKSRWSFVHQKLTRKLTLWPIDPIHSIHEPN